VSPDQSFDALMARLRAGDGDAARRVWERFVRRLVGLARARLDTLVRGKVDPEDVVQSAFRSFFLRHADGQFDLDGWGGLWGLLALITARKCGRQVRHFYGPVHDVRKEAAEAPGGDGSSPDWEAVCRGPTPEEAAALCETLERLTAGLSAQDRRILELRLQGCTVPEISAQVGRTEFTVEGRLKKIRKAVNRLLPPDPEADREG
jgi:RNA polymerase sigma-70 factor (ECF subfamily)